MHPRKMDNNNNLFDYLKENDFHGIFSFENSLLCQYHNDDDEHTFIIIEMINAFVTYFPSTFIVCLEMEDYFFGVIGNFFGFYYSNINRRS